MFYFFLNTLPIHWYNEVKIKRSDEKGQVNTMTVSYFICKKLLDKTDEERGL